MVRRLPRPRPAKVLTSDLVAGAGFVVAVTLGIWWQHGGLSELLSGGVGTLSGLGQLSGLIAALAALGGIILSSRPRFIERRYGQDQLLAAHRWFGIVTVVSVVVHAVTDTWAWGASTGGTIVSGLVDLLANEAWMVAATVGTVLMIVIGLSSWRRVRRLVPYETWYFVHLTGYLAVLLGFGHQLTLGADFATDTFAFWWWSALFAATAALVLYARLGDVVRSVTRRFYVTAVSREANGIGSLHVSGPGLRRLRVAGGQFFNVRPLTRNLWWQAHPFSVSAAPTTAGLRFTIKELGDDSTDLLRVPPGTRVILEGPYGVFTAEQAEGAPLVLVAGGVGISPIRAILEDCGPASAPDGHRARARRVRSRAPAGARTHGRRAQRLAAHPDRAAALVHPHRSVLPGDAARLDSRPAGSARVRVRTGLAGVRRHDRHAQGRRPHRPHPPREIRDLTWLDSHDASHPRRPWAASPSSSSAWPTRRSPDGRTPPRPGDATVRARSHAGGAQAPADTQAEAPAADSCASGGEQITGGAAMTPWGPVQVSATVAGQQVCSVQALTWPASDRKSQMINSYAIPQLDAMANQSPTQFDYVSGATYTSQGYHDSLQSILDSL